MKIPPREDEEIIGAEFENRRKDQGYDDEMRKKSGQICVCVCNVETISIEMCVEKKERTTDSFVVYRGLIQLITEVARKKMKCKQTNLLRFGFIICKLIN